MIFIDVYTDDDKLRGSFDIENDSDWLEYIDWFDYQIALGYTLYEITRYQEEDQ